MKTKLMNLLLAAQFLLVGAACAATYNFTNLLDNTGNFALFYHCATINNPGVVAFHAERDSGVKGIYRTDGTTVTTIVDDSTGEFSFHPVPRSLESRPAIDDDGTVAFFIYHRLGDWDYAPSVRTGSGGPTTVIAESSTTGTFYDALSNPAIRNGVVSFRGGLNAPPDNPWGVFTAPALGGGYAIIAQDGGQFTDALGETSINAGGQVAYYGSLTNGTSGIFVGPDGATTIAKTGPDSQFYWLDVLPKISDSGGVVFHAELTNLNYGNFVGIGGAVTQITVAGGGETDDPYPSINSAGTVACYGRLASGRNAILAGTGPVVDKVIAKDDALFGSTVIGLGEPGSHGLNNNGQIVFTYSLENGVEGIAIATPGSPPSPTPILLSEPTSLGGDQFRFTLTSALGAVLQIWSSINLSNWSSSGFVTNSTGTTNFTDSAAATGRKFYRAQQQ